jgi:hypothetical protein
MLIKLYVWTNNILHSIGFARERMKAELVEIYDLDDPKPRTILVANAVASEEAILARLRYPGDEI